MHPGLRAPWFGLHLRRGNSLIGARQAAIRHHDRQHPNRVIYRATGSPFDHDALIGQGEVSVAEPERVAVIEVSDDANEDRWADAFWQAECAAREAAVAAGAESDKLTVERDHRGSVIVRGSDGRAFQAVGRTTRSMHSVELPHVARPE